MSLGSELPTRMAARDHGVAEGSRDLTKCCGVAAESQGLARGLRDPVEGCGVA